MEHLRSLLKHQQRRFEQDLFASPWGRNPSSGGGDVSVVCLAPDRSWLMVLSWGCGLAALVIGFDSVFGIPYHPPLHSMTFAVVLN